MSQSMTTRTAPTVNRASPRIISLFMEMIPTTVRPSRPYGFAHHEPLVRLKPSHVSGYVFGLYRCQSALLAVDGYLVWGEERGLHQC